MSRQPIINPQVKQKAVFSSFGFRHESIQHVWGAWVSGIGDTSRRLSRSPPDSARSPGASARGGHGAARARVRLPTRWAGARRRRHNIYHLSCARVEASSGQQSQWQRSGSAVAAQWQRSFAGGVYLSSQLRGRGTPPGSRHRAGWLFGGWWAVLRSGRREGSCYRAGESSRWREPQLATWRKQQLWREQQLWRSGAKAQGGCMADLTISELAAPVITPSRLALPLSPPTHRWLARQSQGRASRIRKRL